MQMASSSLLSPFVLVLVLLFSISSAYTSKSSILDGNNQNPIKMIKVADGVSEDLLKLNGMEVKNDQQSGNGLNVIVGPWGRRGPSDTYFDDGANEGLTEIGFDYVTNVAIVGINITYANGEKFNITGWAAGNASATIVLDYPNEYISEVSGTTVDHGPLFGGRILQLFGGRILSLTFKTNTSKTFGPYGNKKGKPFNLPIESGFIVGFKGSVGEYLSSLGMYLSP